MKTVALIAMFAAICLAQDAQKPVCNAKIRGQFWPEEANSSPEAIRRFTQRGEIEICSQGYLKYKWVRLSVNVRDLAKGKAAVTRQLKASDAGTSK